MKHIRMYTVYHIQGQRSEVIGGYSRSSTVSLDSIIIMVGNNMFTDVMTLYHTHSIALSNFLLMSSYKHNNVLLTALKKLQLKNYNPNVNDHITN